MCRLFLLGDLYGAARMGLSRLLGVCATFLFASSVGAANIIDLGPSDYKNFGPNGSHTGAGIRSSTGQTVRMPPGSATLSVTRNPVIPYGSVANGLRSFVRVNPASIAASAAITGLFLAVDWVWDEAEQSWGKQDLLCPTGEICEQLGTANVPGYCNGGVGGSNLQFGEQLFTTDRVTSIGSANYPAGTVINVVLHRYDDSPYPVRGDGYYLCQKSQFPELAGTANRVRAYKQLIPVEVPVYGEYEETFIDLDSSDWSELEGYLPTAEPNRVSDAAGDAQRRAGAPLPGYQDQTITGPSSVSGPSSTSTSTDPVTGDTVVTSTNTTTNISYGDTTITTTNTTTSTTYQNGQETSTTTTTETPGELPVTDSGGAPPAGEWPGFCDWATVVCDWLNWTQEEPPPEEDLPQVIDDDFYEEKRISFGAKSCPPPHEVNLAPFLETTVGVSFQPLCDFAGLIYYMVMAASYIIAAYISIGVARA